MLSLTACCSVEGPVPFAHSDSSLSLRLAAMTIRVTCDECGSVLKIKDELAGTDGKCPKCKTRFVVPQPSAGDAVPEGATESTAVASPSSISAEPVPPPSEKTLPKAGPKPSDKPTSPTADKPKRKPAEVEEFDPVSFLMDGPKKKPSLDPDPVPVPRSPLTESKPSRNGAGGGGFSLDDDDSAPDQETEKPAPTRKWGAKKDAAAASSLDGSKNAARDLLAKSMEESRVRASEMPEEQPRFSFDFAGLFREIGVKGLGSVAAVIVAVFGIWWVMNNMIGTRIRLPPLGYVSGTVTMGGKPAVGVKVYFCPLDRSIEGAKEKKEHARDSVGVTDAEGHFDMYYTAEAEGVKVGACRVTIESSDPAVVIPRSYGMASEHKVDVTSGSNPPQKFEL